jgi:hypothetical protein
VAEQRDTSELVQNILRLRRLERSADRPQRSELETVREFLEDMAGPTIRRAEAARLLGVTQTALDRWIRKEEIPTVVTPKGRREVPLLEVVDLLEDVEEARGDRNGRPLTHAIRERQRRASETVDIDRLLPPRRPRGHRVPELQALAYHRLVGERLDERMVDQAKRRLWRWRDTKRIHPQWAAEWERVREMPPQRIAKTIGADTKRARELRQTSPFAGMLTEQERRRLQRAVEERAGKA